MQQKQQSQSLTARLDGQRLIENLSAYFTAVSYRLGMSQRSDQQEQLLKLLEDELAALNLSLTSSSLQQKCSRKLQDVNLVALNAMISAAKSLRLWLSEESDEAALISLSNLTDDRLRRAKHGQWWVDEPQRGLANNSACYTEKPDFEAFLNEWVSLYESRSGERGIFSRVASQKQAAKNGRRDSDWDFGTNPCSEIILRPNQFCNLSEVVVRSDDTYDTLRRKVRIASILGTLQATLTDFRYLRKKWKENTEEEALLGVSMTGILDHPVLAMKSDGDLWFNNGARVPLSEILEELKNEAIATNKTWAKKLGINQSAAITCVKPSGTVSQLVDSASGIHGRFADHYIRRVRADSRDPLCSVLEAAGVPVENDNLSPTTKVFSFVKKAPEGAVMASDQTGLEQLELWTMYQEHWCEHKPSITVYYRDSEYLAIGNWLYNNFDDVSGVSFLPYSDHTYEQAPYEAITEEQYNELVKAIPEAVDWNINEATDVTEGSQELACVGGACEIV
jgi:ribonucleoside-triphosphate reductase (thioredoxin)